MFSFVQNDSIKINKLARFSDIHTAKSEISRNKYQELIVIEDITDLWCTSWMSAEFQRENRISCHEYAQPLKCIACPYFQTLFTNPYKVMCFITVNIEQKRV